MSEETKKQRIAYVQAAQYHLKYLKRGLTGAKAVKLSKFKILSEKSEPPGGKKGSRDA